MKIIISKSVVSSILKRTSMSALTARQAAVECMDTLESAIPVPSVDEIIELGKTNPTSFVKKLKGIQIGTDIDNVIVSIDDEYVKKSVALVSDFYGEVAAPFSNVLTQVKKLKDICTSYAHRAKALDDEYLAPLDK